MDEIRVKKTNQHKCNCKGDVHWQKLRKVKHNGHILYISMHQAYVYAKFVFQVTLRLFDIGDKMLDEVNKEDGGDFLIKNIKMKERWKVLNWNKCFVVVLGKSWVDLQSLTSKVSDQDIESLTTKIETWEAHFWSRNRGD